MNYYETEIRAFDPKTKEMKLWGGPNIEAISESDAQHYLDTNGLGYCMIIGTIVAEIPCREGTFEPDFDRIIDYEIIKNN